ncbi:MAG: sodium:proton antiporter [Clostridia bacterium]|nr:sodium:proton antiporter [Clostridia bacterium]
MSIFLNPVLISVILLCVLCLFKLNVLMSLVISALAGAVLAGIGVPEAMSILCDGFGANAGTALAYIFLGTFASAVAATGLADMMSKKLSKIIGKNRLLLLLVLAGVASLSQNLVPVHIAFIPIMIPPLLTLFNALHLDRRAVACSLAFGLKAPYIVIPFGFGAIFMGIIADNMTANGMQVAIADVASVNWILALAMFAGLMIAIALSYRKPRSYQALEVDTSLTQAVGDAITRAHLVTIAAVVIVVIVQVISESLALSALFGVLVMIIGGAIRYNQVDEHFASGIKLMGMIAMIMLVAGGYAEVMKATGSVDALVEAAVAVMGGSKWIAAIVITLIGLLVTIGIGSSFSTVPVLAVLYVPLCQKLGFSVPATILLMSAAAALGDAGSPASDTTLGPTSSLNADGQHDHIFDTCVPTFLHYNIPLMLVSIVASQFI